MSIAKKTILILLIILIIANFLPLETYALSDIISQGKSFISKGKNSNNSPIDKTKLQTTSSDIYNILLTIAIVVAIVVAVVLGIQFMEGSVEEQAQIKEKLMPFVIGCIVAFGAFGIWSVVTEIGMKLT